MAMEWDVFLGQQIHCEVELGETAEEEDGNLKRKEMQSSRSLKHVV